jgi:hypothetical protein
MRQFTMIAVGTQDAAAVEYWCSEARKRFPHNPSFVECRLWQSALPNANVKLEDVRTAADAYVALNPPDRKRFAASKAKLLTALALVRAGRPDSARARVNASGADGSIDPQRELSLLAAVIVAETRDSVRAVEFLNDYRRAHVGDAFSTRFEGMWSITPMVLSRSFLRLLEKNP